MRSREPFRVCGSAGSCAALIALVASAACGGESLTAKRADSGAGDGADSGAGADSGEGADSRANSGADACAAADAAPRVPLHHRPDDSQCATPRSPGTCPSGAIGPPFSCTVDSDCLDGGANGRCTNSPGGPAGCLCTYDTCQSDSDCVTGEVCVCHGSANAYGGNACMSGNCRVDSDCGAGGYCSPSVAMGGCGYTAGYYCHSAEDACVDDSDCGGFPKVCAWSAPAGRWQCANQPICA